MNPTAKSRIISPYPPYLPQTGLPTGRQVCLCGEKSILDKSAKNLFSGNNLGDSKVLGLIEPLDIDIVALCHTICGDRYRIA